MINGRVIRSTGSWYSVETESGELLECRMPGKFRKHKIRSTNPVAVGDLVELKQVDDDYFIDKIQERKNYIVRKSVNLSKESHIIAANLDQAILVATIKSPMTFPTFIDRFCVAAEAFHIPVVIAFNKVDLLEKEEREILESFAQVYRDIDYKVVVTSADTGEGLDAFEKIITGKISLLSGHSGVGKSTLINQIDQSLDLRVGDISEAHETGQHTTTFAEMFKLEAGGYIVDTPGIRGFGIVDIDQDELAGYFPEMRKLLPECKFHNCLHVNEPGCAVKKALETGEVAESRYKSYLNMYQEEFNNNYR